MKLTDVTRKISERKSDDVEVASESPRYPYGLKIRLDNEEIDKLGIDLDTLSLEQTVGIVANGFVAEMETRESTEPYMKEEGGKRQCLEIQITGLAMGDPVKSSSEPEAASFTLKDALGKSG